LPNIHGKGWQAGVGAADLVTHIPPGGTNLKVGFQQKHVPKKQPPPLIKKRKIDKNCALG